MPFPMHPLVNTALKIIVPVKASGKLLNFFISEVLLDNISALQHDCFLRLQNVNLILYGAFRMPPILSLFIQSVKDMCTIKTFEKLRYILFIEVNCLHFGVTTRLFSATTNDLSLYEVF